jgi:hypothetical protein
MKHFICRATIIICLIVATTCLISCEKKKEGKVIVTAQDFVLRQDGERSWTLDAIGKVKNVGEVDVKKVVITGYCRSCGEVAILNNWIVSDVEKMANQKDTISYLAAGVEEEFSFKEVVFYWGVDAPESLPEKLEIVIESFETVGN